MTEAVELASLALIVGGFFLMFGAGPALVCAGLVGLWVSWNRARS